MGDVLVAPQSVNEEDLNELYDRVWNTYVGVPPSPVTNGNSHSQNNSPLSPTSPSSMSNGTQDNFRTSSASTGRSRPPRPLPPTPSSALSLARKDSATALSSSGRRLPSTPSQTFLSPNSLADYANVSTSSLEHWQHSHSSTSSQSSPVNASSGNTFRALPPGAQPPAPSGHGSFAPSLPSPMHDGFSPAPAASERSSTSTDHYSGAHNEPWLVPDANIVTSPDPVPEAGPANGLALARGDSAVSHGTDHYFSFAASSPAGPSNGNFARRPTELLNQVANYQTEETVDIPYPEDNNDGYWDGDESDDENRFVDFSHLSHIAVQLRDKVPRGTHVKGSVPYPRAFTGRDIVSTIQALIQRELAINHGFSTNDRRASLQVARSLQSQLFFYEVEWGGRVLQDGVEDVYMFLDEQDGPSESGPEKGELPTGVVTVLTQCYSPSCGEGDRCYAPRCPRNGDTAIESAVDPDAGDSSRRGTWSETVPHEILVTLPASEINRQTIIHKLISKEEQYLRDLDLVEQVFIRPLRTADHPIMPPQAVEEFIDEVFGNILDLRECNRRLLEELYVRQREEAPVIQRIGDVFLNAATEFRLAYPVYIGHYPLAEKRLKDELEENRRFVLFVEKQTREIVRQGETMRLDLKHYLNRPSEHLQKYPVLLEAISRETVYGNPDIDYLSEAIVAIKNLQTFAQLRTFQTAMNKGTPGKWEWNDLVPKEVLKRIPKPEINRQNIIWEIIKGEMSYVKDLENIEVMYIRELRSRPDIIPEERLDQFIQDTFYNFAELHSHHARLVERLHEIQKDEHPFIRSITAAIFDAALNFRDAYIEYIPHYPIAEYRIDDEMANNFEFKKFVVEMTRHADAHRLDMKSFINRPIPRLARYQLLLDTLLSKTPPTHDDKHEIPQVIETIKSVAREADRGVAGAKQKVEIWRYNSNLKFKPGEHIDMDLLDENRSLIHSGKLLRQPESGLEGWTTLHVLLFDNYLVMTKPRDKDGIMQYHVNRRPIPLDLLTLVNFTDPPTQRSTGLLSNFRGGDRGASSRDPTSSVSPDATDSRSVYPFTIYHNGRQGGPYILYAESAQLRDEWKAKLDEAKGLRSVVQESNKVFEIETLSTDTFLVSPAVPGAAGAAWTQDTSFTGKVTCSVPFNTTDGRGLVAIGCAEGVWIGFRHDSRYMRRVLHLKSVTQLAMLEDFGIFLVLADNSLFAYHIEALVPSSPQSAQASVTPQKLNGNREVQFFSVGTLAGRTLVIFMKKKGLDSVFHIVEPVIEKINDRQRAPAGLGHRLGLRSAKSDWFRNYREPFYLPSESFDVIFLRAKIVVLCTKGFEVMDLGDLKSVTIPQRDDPKHQLLAKRCESCKPLGMFKANEEEFLLVYTEFGVYVDKHGDPSRGGVTVEWEGTAERVALHHPYVLLFDIRFVEIRHVETGRLAQIITGTDVHCVWDGRGASVPDSDNPNDQEPMVHGVMNATAPITGRRANRATAQHVFELIPTIPLYLPESLASPAAATYFPPRSLSPPHSPIIRPY